jgi:hypothetical protein
MNILGTLIATILIGAVIAIPFALVFGWPLMLLLGNIAIATGTPGLAIGYWHACIWAALLRSVIGGVNLNVGN